VVKPDAWCGQGRSGSGVKLVERHPFAGTGSTPLAISTILRAADRLDGQMIFGCPISKAGSCAAPAASAAPTCG
jgi:hypothetical protein